MKSDYHKKKQVRDRDRSGRIPGRIRDGKNKNIKRVWASMIYTQALQPEDLQEICTGPGDAID
jgi:hypothetical protein